MTFRIPEENFADKILSVLGKKRALWIPEDVYKRFGQYVIVQARKESFWRALFRPQNQELPKGWFYPLE